MEGVNFDTSDLNGNTPLHLACSLGLYDVANNIIDLATKQGKDFVRNILSKKNNREETPQDNISLSCGDFEGKKALIARMRYFMIDDSCFCDPITMELYADPVITPNGDTFNLESLRMYLGDVNPTSSREDIFLSLGQVRQNSLALSVMKLIGSNKQAVKSNIFSAEVRGILVCALTHRPLIDPVVATNGMTYERSEIEEYLNKNSGRLPKGSFQDKDKNGKYTLYPNTFIKNIIEIIKKYDEDLMAIQSCTTSFHSSRDQQLTIPESNDVLFGNIISKLKELSGSEFAEKLKTITTTTSWRHYHIEIAAKSSCNIYEVFKFNGREFRVFLGVPEEFEETKLERGLFFGYVCGGQVFAINNQTSVRSTTAPHQGIGYNLTTKEVRYGGVRITKYSSQAQLVEAYYYLLAVERLIIEKVSKAEVEVQAQARILAPATRAIVTATTQAPAATPIPVPTHAPVTPVLALTPTPTQATATAPTPTRAQATAPTPAQATATTPTPAPTHTPATPVLAPTPAQILAASAASTTSAATSSLSCLSMVFAASKKTTTPDIPMRCGNSSISEENYDHIRSFIKNLMFDKKGKENEIKALIFILQKTNEGKAVKEVWAQVQQQFPELPQRYPQIKTLDDLMSYFARRRQQTLLSSI